MIMAKVFTLEIRLRLRVSSEANTPCGKYAFRTLGFFAYPPEKVYFTLTSSSPQFAIVRELRILFAVQVHQMAEIETLQPFATATLKKVLKDCF
jgi:predicted transcriptional regulator of viral defense system